MTKFEEELSNLKVAKSENDTEYYNKAQLLTVFKDWQPQQALPVVPECVDLFIKECREFNYDLDQAFYEQEDGSEATENNKCILWRRNHPDEFARAWLDGYIVEKPQLFYIELPNVYGLKNKVLVSKVENGTIVEFSDVKNYALKFTEQEIKSIDPRYWAFRKEVEI